MLLYLESSQSVLIFRQTIFSHVKYLGLKSLRFDQTWSETMFDHNLHSIMIRLFHLAKQRLTVIKPKLSGLVIWE